MDGVIQDAYDVIYGYASSGFAAIVHPSTARGTVLPKIDVAIVEDDYSVREATKHLLQLLGYATASFASAEEFLQSGLAPDSACLITDMRLPGMSGAELQSRLLLEGRRMPIIFVTAFPETGVKAQAMNGGAICFLEKPFDGPTLLRCVERALRT